jgi:4-hydroxybenzoate polyprenyltransferase
MLTFMAKLVDPATKHATAFYAAVGVTVYDVITRGFHPWNTVLMALLAGVGTLGTWAALAAAMKGTPGPQGNE